MKRIAIAVAVTLGFAAAAAAYAAARAEDDLTKRTEKRIASDVALSLAATAYDTSHAEDMCEQSTPWSSLRTGDKIELRCTTPEGRAYDDVAYAIMVYRRDGSLAEAGRAESRNLAEAEATVDAARLREQK